MKTHFSKQHGKWRIIVPMAITGTGKRKFLFFDSKREAEDKAREIRYSGLNPAKDLKADDLALLQLLKNRFGKDAAELIRKLDFAEKTFEAVPEKKRLSLEQVCVAYEEHHLQEQSNRRTIYKYRGTLRRLCAELNGNLPLIEVTKDQLLNVFLKQFRPGGNRAKHQSNLRAFFNWAITNEYLAINPLGKVKMLDKWESNKEILGVEDFQRILCTAAEKYPRLLPYFVLGGLAGVRRAEMISSEAADRDPRIEWTDIDFKLNKIRIRHEVAKETNAADRRRSIPLEPSAAAWLTLVAKTEGPVMAISQSTLQREKEALLSEVGLKVPENALRNSYASYGCAFRSIGDVARAMGDLEVTIKRYYVDLVDDPELGRAWFDIFPGQRKIVPMVA